MNTQHTPGPWRDTGQDITNDHATIGICTVFRPRTANGKANACLIAAAPDLLAACDLFTQAAHDARDALNNAGLACPSSIAFAAEQARAAIAKALGEST